MTWNVGATARGLPVPLRPPPYTRRGLTRHLCMPWCSAARRARAYSTPREVPDGTHTPRGHHGQLWIASNPLHGDDGPKRPHVRCHAPKPSSSGSACYNGSAASRVDLNHRPAAWSFSVFRTGGHPPVKASDHGPRNQGRWSGIQSQGTPCPRHVDLRAVL